MAETLNEVVPDPNWRKLKKATRELFHALGDLRDIQVERFLIKKIDAPSDPLRKYLTRHLGRQEKKQRNAAEKALDEFDRRSWRKKSAKLSSKAQFFPIESVVFQRIASARLNDAVRLYQSAREKKSSTARHQTRIGIKRFRYVVENFLPQRHEVWASDLKRMQDLLGDLHDMDVLARPYPRALHKIQSDGDFRVAWENRCSAEGVSSKFIGENYRGAFALDCLACWFSMGARDRGSLAPSAKNGLVPKQA